MRIHLPAIPEPLRALAWRVREPQLSDLPDLPQVTLRGWTGLEPACESSSEGWPVWWIHAGDCLWIIYELHVFVAVVHIAGIAEAQVSEALDLVLAASIDLSSDEPVALADLIYAPAQCSSLST